MLDTPVVARLVAVCRTTRRWIESPPQHLRAGLSLSIPGCSLWRKCDHVRPAVALPWVQLHATEARMIPVNGADLESALSSLRQLPRLSSLWLAYVNNSEVSPALQPALHSLSPRLTSLTTRFGGWSQEAGIARMISLLPSLPQLRSVTLSLGDRMCWDSDQGEDSNLHGERLQSIDFRPLLQLAHLTSLRIVVEVEERFKEPDYAYSWTEYVCSAARVRVLSECVSLTALHCGQWSSTRRDPRDEDEVFEQGLAVLLSGPLLHTLCDLSLQGTTISAREWPLICQLAPRLTRLWLCRWELSDPAEWRKLATFTQLERCSVDLTPAFVDEDADDVLGDPECSSAAFEALCSCVNIQELFLKSLKISAAQFSRLVACLPQLCSLTLVSCKIESLEALSVASQLQHLELSECEGYPRDTLPAMAELRSLTITDHKYERVRPSEADEFEEEMLQEMPKLTAERITQTNPSETEFSDDDYW